MTIEIFFFSDTWRKIRTYATATCVGWLITCKLARSKPAGRNVPLRENSQIKKSHTSKQDDSNAIVSAFWFSYFSNSWAFVLLRLGNVFMYVWRVHVLRSNHVRCCENTWNLTWSIRVQGHEMQPSISSFRVQIHHRESIASCSISTNNTYWGLFTLKAKRMCTVISCLHSQLMSS